LFQYFPDPLQDDATCIRRLNEFDHSLESEADTASHLVFECLISHEDMVNLALRIGAGGDL
jgi:hypothetical protein